MICVTAQHFALNRILLLAVGLWPFQRSKRSQLQVVFLLSILIIYIVNQLIIFASSECTFDILIKMLPSIICISIGVTLYISFWVRINSVRRGLEYLQHICNNLKDENEIAIIQSYGYITKRFTMALTLTGACFLLMLFVQSMWQNRNIFLLTNGYRPRTIQILVEYFTTNRSYICSILLHTNVVFSISVFLGVGTGSTLIGYFQHACGMFIVASYRIEQAIKPNDVFDVGSKNIFIIHKAITYAVDIHRKAIQYSTFVVTRFEMMFAILIITGVIFLTFNLYRIFHIVSFGNDDNDLLIQIIFLHVIIVYMFLSTYVGQIITDHYNSIFFTAYNVPWYTMPLPIQRLIILLLQRGNKNFTFIIGRLFSANLENFTTLASASMTYFTVLYSMQERLK